MTLKIRQADCSDLETIMLLYRHLHTADVTIDPEIARNNFEHIVCAPHLQIILGEHAGVAVASCYLNVISNLTRGGAPYGVIENVVCHADHRRLGFGQAVVRHGLMEAWNVGCYKVMLLTGNADNIPFYEACGFDASSKAGSVAKPK